MTATHVPLSRQTNAMLVRRVRVLTRELLNAHAHNNALFDELVPYTVETPLRVGDTVMVRVPRGFLPR